INFIKRIETIDSEALAQAFRQYEIDDVIIADPQLSDGQVLEFLMCAHDSGVMYHLVPNMFEVQAGNVLFSTVAGIPLMSFRQTPLEGWGRIAKRLIDILLSIIGLIVLSPVFLLIALLIKLTDPGPVFYGHA